MLTKIEVEDLQGHTLSLPLQSNNSDYVVKDITGLDPVKSNIVTSPYAQLDGSQFQSSRRENRNIILTVGIEPYYGSQTVGQLRTALYAYFMPKNTVNIKLYVDDDYFASIQGQVETCEAVIFSKEPEVAISIICFDPRFISPDTIRVTGNTVTDMTEQTIHYDGTLETGFIFRLLPDRDITEFTIYNRRPGGTVGQFIFVAPLLTDDELSISTIDRSKSATLYRPTEISNILFGVAPESTWINLWPGDNFFRVLAEGAAIPFTIDYTEKYGGL